MRLRVLAPLLAVVGCSAPPPAVMMPPDIVDCQPLRDSFSFSTPEFDVGPRMVPAGEPVDVAVALTERCDMDLATLRPAASVTGPDNVAHPLEIRAARETAASGTTRLVARVTVTPATPGWWLVELSLDAGWARHQVLVYAMENRASSPRHTERVGIDVDQCRLLQRASSGTFVCRTALAEVQVRDGMPPGVLGDVAIVDGDTVWAFESTRLVRLVDSPSGLLTNASFDGGFGLRQADRSHVLATWVLPSERPQALVTHDGDAGLSMTVFPQSFASPLLLDGGVVDLCPGPACNKPLFALVGGTVYFIDDDLGSPRRMSLDGGAATRLDLGPGRLNGFGQGVVAGRPFGVLTPDRRVALVHDLDGTPRVVWLGGDVVGVGEGVALVRGAAPDEVDVVPLDF